MSNLYPSNKKGLFIYFCITIGSLNTTSYNLFIKDIPLPLDNPTGFNIHKFLPFPYDYLNFFINAIFYPGKKNV